MIFFFSYLYIDRKGQKEKLKLVSARPLRHFVGIKVQGITTLDSAADFVGRDVFVPESELPQLPVDSYFLYHIDGFSVERVDGRLVGKVKDIWPAPGNEMLVVDRDGKEILIPFVSSICLRVDSEARKIIVDPPDGLLELNEI